MPEALETVRQALELVFPGFKFGLDDPAAAERLAELGVGGFCLYGGGVQEVSDFTRRLQARARAPLLFCGDYEDGIASHVAGGTAFPPNMALGAAGSSSLARAKGRVTAIEARALGVRWVLAPVLDLATRPENSIVNVRSFGSDPKEVARLGRAYLEGLAEGGVLSCVKHFPGHGGTTKDSHLTLPRVTAGRRDLQRRDLVPFRLSAPKADSMMLAHLGIPAVERRPGVPSSLSAPVVTGLLRRGLGYRRLVATDALSMNAVAARYPREEEACAQALDAGADVLLVPRDAAALAETLPSLLAGDARRRGRVREAHARLARAKKACGLYEDRGLEPESSLAKVGSADHRAEAARQAEAALTWVRRPASSLVRAVRYLEPGSSPGDWSGQAFVGELRSKGIEVRPYPEGEGPVVAALFLRPRAYQGTVQVPAGDRAVLSKALRRDPRSILVSFGSPFVFDEVRGWKAGLCAFCDLEPSQRAAARALMGLGQAPGSMPVGLKTAHRS